MLIINRDQYIKEIGPEFGEMSSCDYYVKVVDGNNTIYRPIKNEHLQMIAKGKPTI